MRTGIHPATRAETDARRPAATASDALRRGLSAHRQGDLATAVRCYREALDIRPGHAEAYRLLGLAFLQERRLKEAIHALDRSVATAPRNAIAISNLATAYASAGHHRHAGLLYRGALEIAPDLRASAEALAVLSHLPLPAGPVRDEERLVSEIRGADAPDAERRMRLLMLVNEGARLGSTLNYLAVLYAEDRRHVEASAYFAEAVRCDPAHRPSWMNWAKTLDRAGEYDRALEVVRQAMDALGPDDALRWTEAELLERGGLHEEARCAMERCLGEGFGTERRYIQYGNLMKTLGKIDAAATAFRNAADANRDGTEPWWSISNLKTIRFSVPDLALMQDLASKPDLGDQQRIQIFFAIAKYHADSGDHARAFECWSQANHLKRTTNESDARITYSASEHARFTDEMISAFSADWVADRHGKGHPATAPIFIVSLPRAGSTLVDQILCAHSAVTGTAELGFMRRLTEKLGSDGTIDSALPYARHIDEEEWRAIGEEYLKSVGRHYPIATAHFTDKMPNNFEIIGFILLALPNARIVNCRRNPMDACLANFMQLFAKGQEFSYSLSDLGHFYHDYLRLSDHWKSLFPDRIIEISYEKLVDDQEAQTRRLLDFCGLPFEQGCLEYYRSERPVPTASAAQVRQPISRSAVGRWKHYEAELEELKQLFNHLGVDWQ